MITVYFYRIAEDFNSMNKVLESPRMLTGVLNAPIDLIHPQIKVTASNVVNYNYCYIPSLNRYYFIDGVTIHHESFYVLYLSVDVLQTYKNEILALYGTVTSGANANPYSNDYISGYDVRKTIETLEFENNFNENGSIVLIGVKGGNSN